MANILLPILPGTLPQGSCPANLQEMLVLFAANMQAQLANGRSYFNFGPDKPDPEFQAYPWLRTTDGKWYYYATGGWSSPNNYNSDERRLWVGTLTGAGSLEFYDGGSPGAVTAVSGPMWVEDTSAKARFPVGPGTFPSGLAVAAGGTGGNEQHTLTDAEGATGVHTHAFGITNPASDDAYFSYQGGPATVAAYTGSYVTGGGPRIIAPQTTADLFTLPAGAAGAGVTPQPFSLLPPYYGVYLIRPSGRLYYVIP